MRTIRYVKEGCKDSRWVLVVGILFSCLILFAIASGNEELSQNSTASISGSVIYFQGDVPVDSVEMTLSGGASDTMFTDAGGGYQFAGLETGLDYTVTPGCEVDATPVSAYDASYVLRFLCNISELDENQTIAADVTENGTVSAFDASVILKYIATEGQLPPGHSIGQWSFIPESISYASLSSDRMNQNYVGIIIGDVSGNWRQPTIPTDTVAVWLPELSTLPGRNIRAFVGIGDVGGLGAFSAQSVLTYDEHILSVNAVSDEGTICEFWGLLTYSIDGGKVSLAWAGHEPLEGNGPMVYIDFEVLPDAQTGQTIPLHFENFMFNEGNPWTETMDGAVTVVSAPDIAVSDTTHDFGSVRIFTSKEWTLTVSNVGIEYLVVTDISSDTSVFTVNKTAFTVPPNGSEDITVTFAPFHEGFFEGSLSIHSNDPDEPEMTISLFGNGLFSGPSLVVYPMSHDFGQVAVHGFASKAITVYNLGTVEIIVFDVYSDNPDFSTDKTAFTLQPDSSENVMVTCSPAEEGPTSGTLFIFTNDPDDETVLVSLSAIGFTPDAVVGVSDGSGAPGTAENVVSIYMDNSVEVGGMQLMVNFDSGILTATRVSSTPRTAHLDMFDANVNYGPSQAKLIIFGSGGAVIDPDTGSVAEIYFDVDTGAPSGTYPLTLTNVIMSDRRGNPLLSGIENGQFFVQSQSQYTICGTVTYGETDTPVDSAQMILSGGAMDTVCTDAIGFYQFNGLRAGLDYIVTPVMTNGDMPVTAYDASLILRALCGVYTLSDFDSVTADVTKDGTVSAFDAATILKFSVSNSEGIPSHFIGHWSFIPDRLVYNSLSADQIHQSYEGCICGDVSGNWRQTTIPEDTVVVSVPECNAAPGESIGVCINFSDVGGLEVFSAQCAITYDRSMLTFVGIGCEGTIYGNIGVIEYFSFEDGHIFVAWAGNQPPEEDGTFVPLVFYVSPNAQIGQSCQLHFEYFLFNEGNPTAAVEDGVVTVTPSTGIVEGDRSHFLPNAFALSQNHPNPFNPSTDIGYRIAENRSPVHTTLKIYNVLGQEVRILVDGAKEAGFHTAHWNGRNTDGHVVPNGIYFYRLSIPGIQWSETRTMVLMK